MMIFGLVAMIIAPLVATMTGSSTTRVRPWRRIASATTCTTASTRTVRSTSQRVTGPIRCGCSGSSGTVGANSSPASDLVLRGGSAAACMADVLTPLQACAA